MYTAKKSAIKSNKAKSNFKAKRSPIKKGLINKTKSSNKVYTIQAKGGFRFAWVTKSFDPNKEAFLKPLSDKIRANEDDISYLNIQGIFPRRRSLTDNESLKSNGFDFFQYVSIDDKCTINDWGKEITDELNKCKHLFKYESIFTYSGDVTGEEECCPLTYLLNEDCYSFVKSMYEEAIRDGTLEEDVESQEELFGEDYESHMTNILN